jgi:small-conductance mechanosensitive channel
MGNTIQQYLAAVGVFLALTIIIFLFKKVVLRSLSRLAKRTTTTYDDMLLSMVGSIKFPFYLIVALYASVMLLNVPQAVHDGTYYLLLAGVLYYAVLALQVFVDLFAKEYEKKRAGEEGAAEASEAVGYLTRFAKLVLWLFALLVLLSNMGFDINALIAGLGIGGIAIALAVQNILGDVFMFFTIYFDKPFKKGDFLIIGDDMGTVEKVGMQSTRLKTLRGEELVISNRDLVGSRIHNFKKMEARRVQFGFGIEYGTPTGKLEKIPGMVKEIIKGAGKTRLDRVHFKEFGDFSLNFEVVYYIDSSDYTEYMDTQQRINLGLKRRFEKARIEFAFPTYKIVK